MEVRQFDLYKRSRYVFGLYTDVWSVSYLSLYRGKFSDKKKNQKAVKKIKLIFVKIENIKFKSKRLDGKGWAIGDLLHSYENGAIIVPIEGGGAFSVDSDTICQFTGLKEK